jgi:PAS domain S-box-containing protein
MNNDSPERQLTGERGVAAEALARVALDHAVEAIVVCDEHGEVVRANQAARRLCDGDPLLRPFTDAFPLRAGVRGALSLARVLQGEMLLEGDVALDRHGQPFALHVTASPIVEGHRVLGCVVILTDISDCKREVAGLVASEVRYRRLFESARDGILILDAETGIIVDVNPYLVELLGFTRAEVVDKRLWELGTFHDSRVSEAKFRELQEVGYVRYDDMALETSDGRRAEVEFISNVYLVNGVRVIQCNVRDVSERKRAEALIAKQLNELERWHDVTLGREDRVQELKREVNELCRGAGVAARYPSQNVDPAARTE